MDKFDLADNSTSVITAVDAFTDKLSKKVMWHNGSHTTAAAKMDKFYFGNGVEFSYGSEKSRDVSLS